MKLEEYAAAPQERRMEKKTAKSFFKSIRASYREMKSLEEERDRLFAMLTSTTIKSKDVNVQTSVPGDKMSEIVPVMMELDELINAQVQIIIEKQIEAERIIQQIEDVRYREILRWYYVQNLKWQEVADRMNYDVAYVQRMNGDALIEAERYL